MVNVVSTDLFYFSLVGGLEVFPLVVRTQILANMPIASAEM
jgi:hypothetical protein